MASCAWTNAAIEVVGVEQCLAAGVGGEGVERVLRALEAVGDGRGCCAGVDAGVSLRALRRIAQRSLRDKAAGIDGPDRHASLDGRVDGGMHLRLVVDAIEAHAAGEINQRLLLVELAEHMRRGLQGGELAVGVEDVEFAVVLSEGGAGVCGAGVIYFFGGVLAFADDHGFENAEQTVAILR